MQVDDGCFAAAAGDVGPAVIKIYIEHDMSMAVGPHGVGRISCVVLGSGCHECLNMTAYNYQVDTGPVAEGQLPTACQVSRVTGHAQTGLAVACRINDIAKVERYAVLSFSAVLAATPLCGVAASDAGNTAAAPASLG